MMMKTYLAMLIVSLSLTGCQTRPAAPLAVTDIATEYHLDSGDKINVTVFGEENLSGPVEIDGQGNVSFPLIGSVPAKGLTVSQFLETLRTKLSTGYLKDPKVTVEVATYRPFYILGEVNKPGNYPYINGMTLNNAVAVAGGYTYRADTTTATIKRGNKGELDSGATTPILPGDVITVHERFF
jgi:protein involved in polysaccharide export with SLBB domain